MISLFYAIKKNRERLIVKEKLEKGKCEKVKWEMGNEKKKNRKERYKRECGSE